MIWFGTCINTIKLLVEHHKEFYSVSSSSNSCLISAKIDINLALIREFHSWSNSYDEMKCSTRNLMGKHHYYFYVVGCNWCFKYTYAYCVCRAFHRFVARIRSVNGEEEVRPSTLQNILLYKWFQLSPLGALASRRICNRLATKVWTTKNLPMMQLVMSATFSWLGFSSCWVMY